MVELRRRLGSLVALSGLATITGFVTQMLVAYHFGTSKDLDSYWLAMALVATFGFYVHPLRESLISVVFRSVKAHHDRASEVITAGVILLSGMSGLATVVLAIGATFNLFPHGSVSDSAFFSLLIAFLPFVFLFALSETFNAVLLSFDLALHQAVARLLSALAAVACLGTLGGVLGIYALVLSLLLGHVIVLLVSWQTLRLRGLRWRFAGLAPLRDRAFLQMFGSLLLNYLLAQSYVFIERSTMSELQPGALSAFQYATLLVNVMISLLALPLSSLLWPRFLEQERQGDRSGMLTLLWNMGSPVLFLLMALSAFTWHAAPEVVSLVFERGRFGAESHQQTVDALRMTIFAAVPIALVTLALRALMSQGRSAQVALVGTSMAIIGMTILGVAWVGHSLPMAQAHWAIANACGAILACLLLFRSSPLTAQQIWQMARSIALCVAVVALPLLILPEASIGSQPWWRLILVLTKDGLIYGTGVILLATLCRLISPSKLKQILRFQ
jgi:putative peptidoglycan lipid II flippase